MSGLNAVVASAKRDESRNVEAYFSRQRCDECNSQLAGDRYDIIYREELDGELHEASVCADCYVKLCG